MRIAEGFVANRVDWAVENSAEVQRQSERQRGSGDVQRERSQRKKCKPSGKEVPGKGVGDGTKRVHRCRFR